jgi:hypothetical protein
MESKLVNAFRRRQPLAELLQAIGTAAWRDLRGRDLRAVVTMEVMNEQKQEETG